MQVWLYNDDGAEMLNGSVKQVICLPKGHIYRFDQHGQLIYSKTIKWAPPGRKNDTVEELMYKYVSDKGGQPTTMIGNYIGNYDQSKWRLGPFGRIFDYELYFNDPSKSRLIGTYKYDVNGNMTERDQRDSGFLTLIGDTLKCKYDSKNHLVESNLHMEEFHLIKTYYYYKSWDSHNNWTKRIVRTETMLRDTIVDTVIRKITYY